MESVVLLYALRPLVSTGSPRQAIKTEVDLIGETLEKTQPVFENHMQQLITIFGEILFI